LTQSYLQDNKKVKTLTLALDRFVSLFDGKLGKTPAALIEGTFVYKEPKPAKVAVTKKENTPRRGRPSAKKAPAKGDVQTVTVDVDGPGSSQAAPVQASPKAPVVAALTGRQVKVGPVGVIVSNELFHNGNVEAWKRIIESYTFKYPQYQVAIFYDGERIHDINSLFKWGKVKHGTAIFFSVMGPGEKILDVAKLKKYLYQGASSRYEAFLRGPVGKVLELF